MVLTRSADKRLNPNNRKENLALRTKAEDSHSSAAFSDSEPSIQGSIKRKSKISVDIPPRKRARKSYDGVDDVDDGMLNVDGTPTKRVIDDAAAVRFEVPDSQESPAKSSMHGDIQDQAGLVSPNTADPTPVTTTPSKKKRSARKARQDDSSNSASVATATPTGDHKRFGSEDPLGGQAEEVGKGEDDSMIIEPPASDEDEAPEIATTKAVVAGNVSQSKRTKRTRKTTTKGKADVDPPAIKSADNPGGVQPVLGQSEFDGSITLPILTVDTNHNQPTSTALDSEDSGDSAFVTARTTRHVDAFSTPTGGTPQMMSPSLHQPNHTSTNDSTTDLRSKRSLEPETRSGNPASKSSTLPRKTNNSLEQHRRQTLFNRANASGGSRRRVTFNLQEDWPGKRRNFVVGY